MKRDSVETVTVWPATVEATRAVLDREAPGLIDVVHADALPLRKKTVATHFVEEGFGRCLQDRVSNPTRLLAVLDPHVFLAFDNRQEGLAKTFNLSPVVFVAGCEEYPFDCVRKLEARAQAPPMSKGDRVQHLVRTVAARGLPILMSPLLPIQKMHVIIM